MLKSPHKAFTLIEILIVVAIIGTILAIALPNYFKSGAISKKAICINNLKQIDAAIDQWAAESGISPATGPTEDIYNYVKSGKPKMPFQRHVYSVSTGFQAAGEVQP
jgi:prepilin-type N-terminal cleavage/methylation domain-containing protein